MIKAGPEIRTFWDTDFREIEIQDNEIWKIDILEVEHSGN